MHPLAKDASGRYSFCRLALAGGGGAEQGRAHAGAARSEGGRAPHAIVARPLWPQGFGDASPVGARAVPVSPPSPASPSRGGRSASPPPFGHFARPVVVKPIVSFGAAGWASTAASARDPLASEPFAEYRSPESSDADWATDKERLRGKLLDLGSTFSELDRRVAVDAKQRREIEEQRMEQILHRLARLEQEIESEASHRETANADLEGRVARLLEQMLGRVQKVVEDRSAQLSRSVEALCDRCSTVERGILQFRGEVPSKLKMETAALRQTIRTFASDVQDDRKRRADADALLLSDLNECERRTDSGMQQEALRLARQREVLQVFVDEFISSERSPDFQRERECVQHHVAAVEGLLAGEVAARERADDQVVQAINEYATWLHRSLTLTFA